MERMNVSERPGWRRKVEELGFIFHSLDGEPYWDETAYYLFFPEEIDRIERATNELFGLCIQAVEHVIRHNRFDEMGIPAGMAPLIVDSWNADHPTLYGRFDLAYDGSNDPKLLEFNADTPTSLLEAAVIQWKWLEDSFEADQFNSIHEKLIAAWAWLKDRHFHEHIVYFASMDHVEDEITSGYLLDTAVQAGLNTKHLYMEEIGWNVARQRFVDLDGEPIRYIFKLYPWEWMAKDGFFQHVPTCFDKMLWLEPPWKLLLSCKGILPILWELNPGHPNLLEAHFGNESRMPEYVCKPKFSREGANIRMNGPQGTFESPGEYGAEGYICQALAQIPEFDGRRPVLGSWIVGDAACGMGIRESLTPITDNHSRFVPHIIATV